MGHEDTTPTGSDIVVQLLHEQRRDDRGWRDEIRESFREQRVETAKLRDQIGELTGRISVMESTSEGGDEQHHQLRDRVATLEQSHATCASKDVVDRIARQHGAARRLPRWAEHCITIVVTTACTSVIGMLIHRGWMSADDARALQASQPTESHHGN